MIAIAIKKNFHSFDEKTIKIEIRKSFMHGNKKILLSASNYKNHKQGECNFLINCQMTA